MSAIINGTILALFGSLAASLAVKATLAAALALGAVRLARHRPAAVRHAFLAAAFAVLLLLPIASVTMPSLPVAVPVAAQDATPAPTLDMAAGSLPSVTPAQAGALGAPGIPRSSQLLSDLLSWASLYSVLIAIWLAGAALFLLPVAVGLWRARALRRTAIPWRQGQAAGEGLARNAGIHRRIDVLVHDAIPGPVTYGAVHPAIILPWDAQHWPEEDLERVLVHELEHVRRNDWAIHCLARTACAAYWFHPLVWMAWRRLALEAERSCDDAVLQRADALDYADQLVNFAKRSSVMTGLPLLAMANRGDLTTRIRAVLDSRQRRGRAGAALACLACAAAVFLVAVMAPVRMAAEVHAALPPVSVGSSPALAPNPVIATQAPPRPRFDVVSVKPSPRGESMVPDEPQHGGYWVVRGVPTAWLIYVTFLTQPNLVVGMPAWARGADYDIEARMPPSTTDAQLHLMLKSMLADRFGMVWHTEMRPTEVSVLSAGTPGPNWHPASGHCLAPGEAAPPKSDLYTCGVVRVAEAANGIEVSGSSVTLGDLATFLTRTRMRPVIAESGSKALYDFEVTLSMPAPVQGESPDEVLFDREKAIQRDFRKQLGLEIDMTKAVNRPTPVLVIDHLARASEN